MKAYDTQLGRAVHSCVLRTLKAQDRQIMKAYEDAMAIYIKKYNTARNNTASKALAAEYKNAMALKLNDIIKTNNYEISEDLAKIISENTAKNFTQKLGLRKDDINTFSNALLQICNPLFDKAAENVIKGGIYKDGIGLSARVWDAVSASSNKIRDVIASGLAGQLSAVEMSKLLEQYVNPVEYHIWNNAKIKELLGDGYAAWNKQVNYEALRLARTTITHSATTIMKQASITNPYLTSFKWHSVHAPGRTCGICADRDGQIYTPQELPYDHPNGLCWQEPVLSKSLSKIGDEVADWVHGGENEMLENWHQTIGLPKLSNLI